MIKCKNSQESDHKIPEKHWLVPNLDHYGPLSINFWGFQMFKMTNFN